MAEARERDGERTYLCIDLKTFYASVECIDRGLDPFLTKLVVADPTRGDTTICLAISPAMKTLGVRNRCRIFEIPRGIEYIKAMPRMRRSRVVIHRHRASTAIANTPRPTATRPNGEDRNSNTGAPFPIKDNNQ